MIKRILVSLLLVTFTLPTFTQEPAKFKMYGFVRNDFFINSRQNVEVIDGIFHLFPKPVSLNAENTDINGVPQAEMLSVASRLGVDITGADILGAKSTAKIEADFAGFGVNVFVLRIRQAHMRLNWQKSELLVGQAWHPLFGSVMPTGPSLNAGSPFQPFNRSPQVRLRYSLNPALSLTAAGCYQMQYVSQGPNGPSSSYMKNSLLPDMFIGAESKNEQWTTGVALDVKVIKPDAETLTSATVMGYVQLITNKFQFKAKTLHGQNMSDYLMPLGYGISNVTDGKAEYTNFNVSTTWVNVVYGARWQSGIFLGYSQNLGTTKNLFSNNGNFIAYGSGVFGQLMLDNMYRVAPHVSYNLPNMKFGLEYDLTGVEYGNLKANGRVMNSYFVNNHRAVASISYFF